jgi:hypothetical protein
MHNPRTEIPEEQRHLSKLEAMSISEMLYWMLMEPCADDEQIGPEPAI